MRWGMGIALLVLLACSSDEREEERAKAPAAPRTPVVGACWKVASRPDLGPAYDDVAEQPVDFAMWQAGDGRWQLWSCIRGTKEEGFTRVFHRWEGAKITDAAWTPKGIVMRAGRVTPDGLPNDDGFDPSFGEMKGGLQAPFVYDDTAGGVRTWHMVYGTWGNLGQQTSSDGKTFTRIPRKGNNVTIFDATDSKRDPMFLAGKDLGDPGRLYFTEEDAVMLSTTTDGKTFSPPIPVARGGQAGGGAECPYVVHGDDGFYYLFRTSSDKANGNYAPGVVTYVYASTDPANFGVGDDSHLVAQLPIAAPEIHRVDGVDYIAHLTAALDGIEVCELGWQPHAGQH